MTIGDRHRRILDAVQQAGRLGVTQLAELTGTSEMTVRRDLENLADQGMLERFRGGARSITLRGEEPPFAARTRESSAAKRRIAEAAAEMISDGEAVVLDSGTTCLEVAHLLARRRMTVMPLSLHAANALVGAPQLRVLLPGGEPRPGELALTGPLAEASLAALRFDTAILGCCGLTAEGMTAYDLADASVKRAAIASARRVIALADAAKLDRTALAFVAPVSALSVVITDTEADEAPVAALTAAGTVVQRV
ncbi:DeoR/GlpR family DNA-binding transcription regulator [Actinoplanes sp. NPDC051851]|uniref:DeoR/GlpR family DNA-binding transcription regulator n=1 Tax=Actinoplanes sp. NPDC051851 TaxID=3154753 RepID=UPI003441F21A